MGDKKHGQGSMVWAAQRQQYTGDWVDDNPHGKGVMVWTDSPVQNRCVSHVTVRGCVSLLLLLLLALVVPLLPLLLLALVVVVMVLCCACVSARCFARLYF